MNEGMVREYMMIKQWVHDREQDKARNFNIYIDYAERDDETNMVKVEDGYIKVIACVLAETEKAYKVWLQSGEVVGSAKGWTCWVPKSQVKRVA